MLKKVSFVVWSAFIVWMVFFLFSISQAEANSQASLESNLLQTLPKDPAILMTNKLESYSDFLCNSFTAYEYCRDFAYHIIHDTAQKVPLNLNDPRAYVLSLTLQVCSSANSVTGKMSTERSRCFKLADMQLAAENFGNHPECRTKPSFIWNEKESDLDKEVNCYKNAFAKDVDAAVKEVPAPVPDPAKQTPVDPAVAGYKRLSKNLCHKIQNIEPNKAFSSMPKEFRGLILLPSNSCQKLVVAWAAEGLKRADFLPPERTDTEKMFLQYSLLNYLCLDPVESQKPQFTEKCFYSGGLQDAVFIDNINYLDCLTPDLIPPPSRFRDPFDAAAEKERDTQLAAAERNVAMKWDLKSRECYVNTFHADFAKIQELWQAEQDYTKSLVEKINKNAKNKK